MDHLQGTKAPADASACTVDRRPVGVSPVVLIWMALEAPALKWSFGWKGLGHTGTEWKRGHREIPLHHLISPPPNSGVSPAPPDQPFPAPTREEQGGAAPQAGLPGWWPRERGPQRPGPAGARAHPKASGKAHKAKSGGPRRGRASAERGGAGRAARAGGVGCHPPRTPRPGGGEANH